MGMNKHRATAFCTVAHVCGSSVRNMLHVTPGAQNFTLALRYFKYLCTPGVDSCQDSCTKRFGGSNRGHRYCVLRAICEATIFMTCNSFSCITVNIPSGANLGSNGHSDLNILCRLCYKCTFRCNVTRATNHSTEL